MQLYMFLYSVFVQKNDEYNDDYDDDDDDVKTMINCSDYAVNWFYTVHVQRV